MKRNLITPYSNGIYKALFYGYCLELENGDKLETSIGVRCPRNACGGWKTYKIENNTFEEIENFSNYQPLVVSKDYLELNLDKWDNTNNVLYIMGQSGSGKTTLLNELKDKYNAIPINLDTCIEYLKLPRDNKKDFYYNYLSKLDKSKRYIVEGLVFLDFLDDPTYFKDKPLILVRTSLLKTFFQKYKREQPKKWYKFINDFKGNVNQMKKINSFMDSLLNEEHFSELTERLNTINTKYNFSKNQP